MATLLQGLCSAILKTTFFKIMVHAGNVDRVNVQLPMLISCTMHRVLKLLSEEISLS